MLISDEQKRRYTAFWDRTPTDRACMYITSWDGAPGFPRPSSVGQQWGDLAYREARSVYEAQHTRYHAEAFPSVFTNFGPGCLAAMIGGGYAFAPATVWFETKPCFVEDWEDRPVPRLDPESPMYQMVEEMSRRLLSHPDALFTSITDIGGTYDIVASLRGTENLLYDFYDNPDEIHALRDEIAPIWREYYFSQANRLMAAQGCMTSWMPIWSDKMYYPLQCDMCTMLSPKMFGEYVLPDLREQTEYLARSIYHLDGPDELPHVDALLSLPRLNAIQWTSGDGKPPVTDPCWFELYHRIQAAGKGIVLLGVNPAGIENLLRNVSQRGLFFTTSVRDPKDADAIVDMAAKLNREYTE